jgi:pimeloyl-ACP methyl ester carboxylesterase
VSDDGDSAAPRGLLSDDPLDEAFGLRALARAVYGGADLGECATTTQRAAGGGADAWYAEWRATADRVAAIGAEAEDAGNQVSAREAYLRATGYYQCSYFPLFGEPVDERLAETARIEREAFGSAARLLDHPLESVSVPFEGGALDAWFARPDDSGQPRRTLVQTNGYDGNVHEMYFSNAVAALRRGWNWTGFDGPGQGRCLIEQGMRMRPDWEVVLAAVLEWARGTAEVDSDRIALCGWSFGGFLAPRAAAAHSDDLAALVADPGQWDQREAIVARLPIPDEQKRTFPDGADPAAFTAMEEWLRGPDADPALRWRLIDRGLWVHGLDTVFDYFVEMCRYELSSVAEGIRCPTLLTAAEGDPIAAGAQRLLDAIAADDKDLVPFTLAEGAGGHCEVLARNLYHQRTFDWLDQRVPAA